MICRVLGYADFYARMENAICTGAYWYSYALTADESHSKSRNHVRQDTKI